MCILETLQTLTDIMLISGTCFAALAFISTILKYKYRGVEGKSPEEVQYDRECLLIEKRRLIEGNEYGI